MRRRFALPHLALAAWLLLTTACAGASAPDLVIRHAKVFTNDTARPWAEAVAIKGERVVAVGDDAAIGALAGASSRVIDAGGRVLVPGFNDARVDLPLRPPSPQDLTTLDREAITRGVTSLQVVAGGRMQSLVVAAQQAQRAARWRVIRSPMDGERPQDEEPYLPPQPGIRLFATGVAWHFGTSDGVASHRGTSDRMAAPADRVATAVEWAYRAEDPLIMSGDPAAWTRALSSVGLAQVWSRKRPRLDVREPAFFEGLPALAERGVVVAWLPFAGWIDATPEGEREHGPARLVSAGLVVCLGSAGPPRPMASIRLAAVPGRGLPSLSREQAVRAATWGSAYAEKGERDKGWLAAGTLADLAVLSDDIFTAPAERLPAITSVLTLVGGTIVYDPGVLTSR